MKRNIYLLLALIVATTSILSACNKSNVKTEHPVVGDIQDTVNESGTVYYADNYSITSSVSGRITSCNFEVGDKVKQGQTLYSIDDTDIRNKISSTQISLNTARESSNQAVKAVDDLSVKSYLSGIITETYCNIGDYVATGSKIAQVVDNEHLKLKLPFASTENIQLGSIAKISVSGDTSEIDGTVTKIYDKSTALDNWHTGVFIEISFNNPGALASGQEATATINGVKSISSGTIKYMTDDAIYSTGAGVVTAVKAGAGSSVSPGSVVLIIKNDTITNTVTNSRLNVTNAEETLKQLQSTLDNYTIKAPVSGTILKKTAKTSDMATAASALATLSSGDTINVNVDIDEKYISKVSVGQSTNVSLPFNSKGTVYSGVVKEISNSGTVTNGVTYYTVKISLDRQDDLKDGMNVNVSIIADSKKNCALVPKAYLIDGNKIEVMESGKRVTKDVKVGISDSKNAEIISGLSETDEIISK